MEKINSEKVCRTCLTEQDNMVNICSSVSCNENTLPIIKMLNSLLSTEITEDDRYPKSICSNCVELAFNAYKFKLQCDQSQSLLEEYYRNYLPVKAEVNGSIFTFNNKRQSLQVAIKVEDCLGASNTNTAETLVSLVQKELPKKIRRKYKKRNVKMQNDHKGRCEHEALFVVNTKDSETDEIEIEKQISKDLDSVFFCSKCNKSFKNKYVYSAHEKRHEFKGHFLCNVCGKGFSSQSCLNRHNRVHTGERKYECKECHKRFPSSNNLNLHSRIHTGHKPYLCTICGKRFSHPTGLTYHMRTHTHEKPYSCELCGKRFAIQCHFDRHKKTHSGERPFACAQCGRAFIKKIDLQRHEEIHTGLKPHSCNICKKSFLRIKNLNFHMMLHTEERPHRCPECGKGFIRTYYLRDHIRKHHN